MKKRFGANGLAVLLSLLLLAGCFQQPAFEQGQQEAVIEEVMVVDVEVVEEQVSEPTVAMVDPYPYKQELNIIEDNYRNYYEIFVYSFYDSDGDGIGDINGVISQLDHVNDGDDTTDSDMGFNGLWLMPIMPSTTYHKYDVIDYYDIDPDYGTLEDFKKLIAACDEREIALIIDLVLNHTSTEHEWFVEATTYLESLGEDEVPDLAANPYVDYYHFTRDYEGSDSYHRVGQSDWYYEGVFWGGMPDLNLGNEALRSDIEAIAKYWLDMGVDGFRLDAAKEFYSDDKTSNIEVLSWFSDYVEGVEPEVYVVGEVWDSHSTINEYYTSGVTSLFNFPFARYDGGFTMTARQLGTASARTYGRAMAGLQGEFASSNPSYIDAPFISNHDTTRISAQCVNNEDQMKMVAGLLLTSSGSPFVYYGEEIGMNSMGSKDENKRLPMQWSITDLDGMTRPPEAADEVEQKFDPVDVQLTDPYSLLNYYKRAIRIRNENPEIARGQVTFDEGLSTNELCVLEKDYEGSRLVLIHNINNEPAVLDLNETQYASMAIRGYLTVDESEVILNQGLLELPKYSIAILK